MRGSAEMDPNYWWQQLKRQLEEWKDPDPRGERDLVSATDIMITLENLIDAKIEEAKNE